MSRRLGRQLVLNTQYFDVLPISRCGTISYDNTYLSALSVQPLVGEDDIQLEPFEPFQIDANSYTFRLTSVDQNLTQVHVTLHTAKYNLQAVWVVQQLSNSSCGGSPTTLISPHDQIEHQETKTWLMERGTKLFYDFIVHSMS